MKKVENKNNTLFSDHLDSQYGKPGSAEREKYEEEFEAFKLKCVPQLKQEEEPNQKQV